MIRGFEFEEDGRKFSCKVEARRSTPDDGWWWFDVSGDRQRYAPFQAATADTQKAVKARIVAFYTNVLEARARPVEPRSHWGRRPKVAAAAGEAGVAGEVAEAVAE